MTEYISSLYNKTKESPKCHISLNELINETISYVDLVYNEVSSRANNDDSS